MNILISAFTTILFLFLHQVNAQALDNVYFHDNSNFTYCYQSHFTVTDVTRYYNVKNSSYFLNFSSTTNVNVSNLNQQGTSKSWLMSKKRSKRKKNLFIFFKQPLLHFFK